MAIDFVYNDGGRKDAGFQGNTGDCVVRSIAIAAQLPYQEVYDELFRRNKIHAETRRSKVAKRLKEKGASPRNGNFKEVYSKYIEELGFTWVPTMKIGQGCTTHLSKDELPNKGRIICRVSRHICAVIDGKLNDTHDCSRDGKRCVYGYWHKEQTG